MILSKTKFGTLAACTLLALGIASPANAQGQAGGAAAQAQAQATAADFSDAKINAYINSAMKVSQIHMAMAPQIKGAQSQEQKQQLSNDMQSKMVGAVQQTEGITVEEYNQISAAAQQNPQLAQRIRTNLEAQAKQQQAR